MGSRVDSGLPAVRYGYICSTYQLRYSQPGSVIEEPKLAVERASKMIEDGTVSAINGEAVHLGEVHTICVHGDTPNAVEMVRTLKSGLLAAKIDVKPVGSFLQ